MISIIFAELCIGVKCVFDDRDSGCAGSLWSIVQVKPEFPCLYFQFFSFLFNFVPYMTFISDLKLGFYKGIWGLWIINYDFVGLPLRQLVEEHDWFSSTWLLVDLDGIFGGLVVRFCPFCHNRGEVQHHTWAHFVVTLIQY